MLQLTSHLLNALTGDHAAGVAVKILAVSARGDRRLLCDTQTDHQGRLAVELPPLTASGVVTGCYQMVIQLADYFASNRPGSQRADDDPDDTPAVTEIIIPFRPCAAHPCRHIPVIIAPHSYTVWWSG